MKLPFRFYEYVNIVSPDERLAEIKGQRCVISDCEIGDGTDLSITLLSLDTFEEVVVNERDVEFTNKLASRFCQYEVVRVEYVDLGAEEFVGNLGIVFSVSFILRNKNFCYGLMFPQYDTIFSFYEDQLVSTSQFIDEKVYWSGDNFVLYKNPETGEEILFDWTKQKHYEDE